MKKLFLILAVAIPSLFTAKGEDFFSTDDAENLFTFGARIGINTSNRTLSGGSAYLWNQNSWGTGFDAGVVADINFKNFISVQPGFFYESRSGAFAYQSTEYTSSGFPEVLTQLGKGREYLFTIPIVGSLHFNVLDELRWNIDLGPYFQFKLRSTFDGEFAYPLATMNGGIEYFNDVKTSRCDIGLKIGTGLDIFEHYYVGVHYLAGFMHPWNPGKLGGRNKAWLFTIGYNL